MKFIDRYLVGHYIEQDKYRLYIDKIKIELDWRIYHYGDNYSKPFSKERVRESFGDFLRNVKNKKILYRNNSGNAAQNLVLSTVYFSNFNAGIASLGYSVKSPVWLPSGYAIDGDRSLYKQAREISRLLKHATFNGLISDETIAYFDQFESDLYSHISKVDPVALFLFSDQLYFSKVGIEIFRKIGRKSFVLSHGLPGIYSEHVDNRSDYLLVWGEKIKDNYIKAGFNANKVLVSGHPVYSSKLENLSFRSSFDEILVLPKAISWHQHTYDPIIVDRGLIIVYLLSIQKVLQKLGVKKVRLRPHPSASVEWMMDFLDPDFFRPDKHVSLSASLKNSSLVVGPTSTVFLESLLQGVNYTIYEPELSNLDLFGYDLVPPFDGSDPEIPVAKNEEELYKLLKLKTTYSPDVLSDYLEPYNVDVIDDVLKP